MDTMNATLEMRGSGSPPFALGALEAVGLCVLAVVVLRVAVVRVVVVRAAVVRAAVGDLVGVVVGAVVVLLGLRVALRVRLRVIIGVLLALVAGVGGPVVLQLALVVEEPMLGLAADPV